MGKIKRHRGIIKKSTFRDPIKPKSKRKMLGRRALLLAVPATVVGLGVGLPYLFDNDEWDFLEENEHPDVARLKKMGEYFFRDPMAVKLGQPLAMQPGTRIWNGMFAAAVPEIHRMNANGQLIGGLKKYECCGREFRFGIPDYPERIELMHTYIMKLMDLLYNKIPDFDPSFRNLEFPAIKQGDDFSQSYERKCLMGNGFFSHYILGMVHESKMDDIDRNIIPVTLKTDYHQGAYAEYNVRNKKIMDKDDWYAFLSTGPSANKSVFSELLPVEIVPYLEEFESKYGKKEVVKLMEAYSEAIAMLIGMEAADKYGTPGGAKKMQEEFDSFFKLELNTDVYDYVPGALEWMRSTPNGIAKAHELIRTDSEKFYTQIRSYRSITPANQLYHAQ